MSLNMNEVKKNLEMRLTHQGRDALMSQMQQLQVAVFVMIGGGLLGNSAVTRPSDFYVDSRCGKLPYKIKEIQQSVFVLKLYAEILGLDSSNLRYDCQFHNCGVF